MLAERSASVNVGDPSYRSGKTLLGEALRNYPTAEFLLLQGADSNYPAQGYATRPPLFWAASDHTPDVIELLLKHGANANIQGECR